MIDQKIVKKLFYYDAESGMLIWRFGNGRNVKPWQEVKAKNGHGYYIKTESEMTTDFVICVM